MDIVPHMKNDIIQQTAAYVQKELSHDRTGHDWWHIERVRKLAKVIGKAEGADMQVVELAALLHDIADYKFHKGDSTVGPKKAQAWLESMEVDENVINHVVQIIATMSYSSGLQGKQVTSIEGMVVQDADRLDAIGAVGIARCFAYGGSKGHEIYNPDIPPRTELNVEEYKKDTGTQINHFYEKLLLLKDRMNTKTAKQLAEKRHTFMENFLSEFYDEWNGTA